MLEDFTIPISEYAEVGGRRFHIDSGNFTSSSVEPLWYAASASIRLAALIETPAVFCGACREIHRYHSSITGSTFSFSRVIDMRTRQVPRLSDESDTFLSVKRPLGSGAIGILNDDGSPDRKT